MVQNTRNNKKKNNKTEILQNHNTSSLFTHVDVFLCDGTTLYIILKMWLMKFSRHHSNSQFF